MRSRLVPLLLAMLTWGTSPTRAATYYISPSGNDANDGISADRPWKSVAKANAYSFQAGDLILFHRDGQWRECLLASSNGKPGTPITYDAYGTGAKPRLWGSDLLPNANFTALGHGRFSCPMPMRADTALRNHLFIPATWSAGVLTITVPDSDPRTDGTLYSACTRGNVLFSNRKSHLIFRNLIVDETAAQLTDGNVQGYGVRIEGGTDVVLENCGAYRCGRHHFAAINSSAFVGRHLHAAFAQPDTPGGNTFYVSFADTGAASSPCTSEWDDISAVHLEDGKGGQYPQFVSHGNHLGLVTMRNVNASGKLSFMSAPVEVKGGTLRENASIENFGAGLLVDGVTLLDSSAIDQWGSQATIQNCTARLKPVGHGPTGYAAAIVLRDKARGNVIRFNTLLTGPFAGIALVGEDSATRCYGNIFLPDAAAIAKPSGNLGSGDLSACDSNFYSPGVRFAGKSLKEWQLAGFDEHSQMGDPKFKEQGDRDLSLKPDSPCRNAAKIQPSDIPPTDAAGNRRRRDIGAYEFAPSSK
jgi:hypothetical protein